MKIVIFSLYSALACAQRCRSNFDYFAPEELGYDVVPTGSNGVGLIKARVPNDYECYNLCRNDNRCNGFTFSDRQNGNNCWIKQFDIRYTYNLAYRNKNKYNNICFYKKSNINVKQAHQQQRQQQEQTQQFGQQYGYQCAGQARCLSNRSQINGNMLCSPTFRSLEEADYYCTLSQCDGILANRQSTNVNNHRYEAVNKVGIQQSCQLTRSVDYSAHPFEFISRRRQKRSESKIIQTKQTIRGHDVKPFTQIETHFPEANVTVYNVDPHNQYDRNFVFVFHDTGKIVGVTPESCMMVFQDVPLQNYTKKHDDVITPGNYETVDLHIQSVKSKNSIFQNSFLKSFCSGKELIEEEYLVNASNVSDNDEILKITENDKIIRNSESTRLKRGIKTCKLSNCKDTEDVYTHCNRKDHR